MLTAKHSHTLVRGMGISLIGLATVLGACTDDNDAALFTPVTATGSAPIDSTTGAVAQDLVVTAQQPNAGLIDAQVRVPATTVVRNAAGAALSSGTLEVSVEGFGDPSTSPAARAVLDTYGGTTISGSDPVAVLVGQLFNQVPAAEEQLRVVGFATVTAAVGSEDVLSFDQPVQLTGRVSPSLAGEQVAIVLVDPENSNNRRYVTSAAVTSTGLVTFEFDRFREAGSGSKNHRPNVINWNFLCVYRFVQQSQPTPTPSGSGSGSGGSAGTTGG